MTQRKTFETAAARRRRDPIGWIIDGHEINMTPTLEFGDLAGLVALARDTQPGGAAPADDPDFLEKLQAKIDAMRDELGRFVSDDTKAGYDAVKSDLDVEILLELVTDITAEVSGRVPTLPSPSSDGSSMPGTDSTATATPVGSIPSPARPTE